MGFSPPVSFLFHSHSPFKSHEIYSEAFLFGVLGRSMSWVIVEKSKCSLETVTYILCLSWPPGFWHTFPCDSLPGLFYLQRCSQSRILLLSAHYISSEALFPSLPLPFIWHWSHTAPKLLRSSESLCGNTALKPLEVWKKFSRNSGRSEVLLGSLQ